MRVLMQLLTYLKLSHLSNSPLASFIRNHFDIDLLQDVGHCRCSMPDSSPSRDGCHFSDELRLCRWQTDRQNVLLELHITVELDERDVILEIAWRVARMNLFPFDQILLVHQSLVGIFHIVLAQAHFEIRVGCRCNAMS